MLSLSLKQSQLLWSREKKRYFHKKPPTCMFLQFQTKQQKLVSSLSAKLACLVAAVNISSLKVYKYNTHASSLTFTTSTWSAKHTPINKVTISTVQFTTSTVCIKNIKSAVSRNIIHLGQKQSRGSELNF